MKTRSDSPICQFRCSKGLTLEALGRQFSVDKSTVLRWETRRVPADRVLDVERITGIPRAQLRPDLYASEVKRA